MTDHRPLAPIEELCALASQEHWCWNLSCRTCGHELFRFALKDLVAGRTPVGADWRVRQRNVGVLRSDLGISMEDPAWGHRHQQVLNQMAAAIRIDAIAAQCRFPAWLGYLGLFLSYSEAIELDTRALTRAWIPQLIRHTADPAVRRHLTDRLDDPGQVLRLGDLERVERGAPLERLD